MTDGAWGTGTVADLDTHLIAARLRHAPHRLVAAAVAGSHTWGLATPDSDVDVRGVYAWPLRAHFAPTQWPGVPMKRAADTTHPWSLVLVNESETDPAVVRYGVANINDDLDASDPALRRTQGGTRDAHTARA